MSAAWKALELRIAKALGGRRAGPQGAPVSDVIGVPWSVEIKRSIRPGPPVLSTWITQARDQARREGNPWLLVVAGHNDRQPIVTMDFQHFLTVARQAGWIPTPELARYPPGEASRAGSCPEQVTAPTLSTTTIPPAKDRKP